MGKKTHKENTITYAKQTHRAMRGNNSEGEKWRGKNI